LAVGIAPNMLGASKRSGQNQSSCPRCHERDGVEIADHAVLLDRQ